MHQIAHHHKNAILQVRDSTNTSVGIGSSYFSDRLKILHLLTKDSDLPPFIINLFLIAFKSSRSRNPRGLCVT